MKKLTIFFFTLLSFCAIAQTKTTQAIKIYLEDAETGKNIPDARVTLEGFEIPALTAKYGEKEKVYYFDEIPPGYNTVMAYHEKYNEKGFQDVQGLPKELKLKLYDPFYVSYSFEKPVLNSETCCNGKKWPYRKEPKYLKRVEKSKRKISKKTFRYIYREDPYHIAVISKLWRNPSNTNDTMNNLLKNLSIEDMCVESDEYTYSYCALYIDKSTGHPFEFMGASPAYQVYVFQKKDGTKFQRFNDPAIKALRQQGLIVSALTTRKLEYYANKPFNVKKFYGRWLSAEESYRKYKPKPLEIGRNRIEISFFDTKTEDYNYYLGIKEGQRMDLPRGDEHTIYSLFFAISKDKNSGIGLGVLDEMEINGIDNKYLFTNTYKD